MADKTPPTDNTANTAGASSAFDYLSNDGIGGFDALNVDTVAFPFVRVLQSLSPQLKKSKPEYVEGAAEGDLYNNITNRIMVPPVKVIVGRFDRYFTEWKPNRGGFVAAHLPEEIDKALATGALVRDEKGRVFSEATGNQYTDTYAYYVVFPDYLQDGVCLLCLSSTQLKEARRWNRLLMSMYLPNSNIKALPYHMRWIITTPMQTNDRGEWAGFKVDFDGFVTKEEFQVVTAERKALPAPDAVRPDFRALDAGERADAIDSFPVYDADQTSF